MCMNVAYAEDLDGQSRRLPLLEQILDEEQRALSGSIMAWANRLLPEPCGCELIT